MRLKNKMDILIHLLKHALTQRTGTEHIPQKHATWSNSSMPRCKGLLRGGEGMLWMLVLSLITFCFNYKRISLSTELVAPN